MITPRVKCSGVTRLSDKGFTRRGYTARAGGGREEKSGTETSDLCPSPCRPMTLEGLTSASSLSSEREKRCPVSRCSPEKHSPARARGSAGVPSAPCGSPVTLGHTTETTKTSRALHSFRHVRSPPDTLCLPRSSLRRSTEPTHSMPGNDQRNSFLSVTS